MNVLNDGYYIGFFHSPISATQQLCIGKNISDENGSQRNLSLDTLDYLLLTGDSGLLTAGGNKILLNLKNNGFLYKGITDPYTKIMKWKIPYELVSSREDIVTLYINNRSISLFVLNKDRNNNHGEENSVDAIIFNKQSTNWHKKIFPGDRTEFRSFGKWIACHVCENFDGRNIPGESTRLSLKNKIQSIGFDARARFYNI